MSKILCVQRMMGNVFACVCALLCAACNISGGGIDGIDESLDNIPPSAIIDLTVIRMSPSSVSLCWSAPGDDNDSGTAAAYDLRYLQSVITENNFDSSLAVAGMDAPSAPHAFDSVSVSDLKQDSTYYFAIKTTDEAGNWSNLSNVVQAVCFDDYEITLADTALERVVRFYIGKPDGDILRSDMLNLWRINASGQHIHELSGIEYGRNLTGLFLWNNSVRDLSPLSDLDSLRVLDLGYNGLSDIGPLEHLTGLDTLKLNSNQIENLSALTNLNNLTCLELASNVIWNLSPLSGKSTIEYLALDGNQIVFVNALYNLTGLEKLKLTNNQIEDILTLSENDGLNAGDTVWLSGNPLSASSTDSLMAAMRNRGVTIIR